ncbi:MAG: succinylglutamate desuccinylase/aspartoacylase family protein, partial [Alphaproteobacteria bacterium]|nr:succinylglutamate desuccinylase/aspartoacylase family protein [Alphaproteobacteria bacterium]
MKALLLALLIAAAPAEAQTRFTGDRVDGVPVIDRLDAAALKTGTYRFWFRAGDTALGHGWYVPVVVVRGARPGPKLLLTAAVHGDELNGIDVIHRLVATLDPKALVGTVTAVPGVNTPGLLQGQREFSSVAAPGLNLNRVMPGDEAADDPARRYAGRLWNRIFRPNADTAVDLHTQSRGTAYVLYAFAEAGRPQEIARLMRPDIIKLDPGEKGTVENELNRVGIPSITLELGKPDAFDPEMVARGVAGVRNLMIDLRMIEGAVTPPADTYEANAITVVRTPRGGIARLLVALGAEVEKDQPVAIVTDAFGLNPLTL